MWHIVTYIVIHDTDLWNGNYYIMSLSSYDMHLKANAKVLTTFLIYLAHFIQKHPLKSYPIEQFLSILRISFYVWRLLQAVSEAS